MQNQTIYSYLQRSLVKILSKSSYSNKYKTPLVKPLNTCLWGIAGSARPISNSLKLVPLVSEVALQNQTVHFFRKVNTSFMSFLRALDQVRHHPSVSFSCKFGLISFRRPRFAMLILNCDKTLLLSFAKQKQSQAPKTTAILLANPVDQSLCKAPTNFDFYIKQSKHSFRQTFYKRKDKFKYYRKTFINLFYFFSFFTTNKEVGFFYFAELNIAKQVSFSRYAKQALYLHKIYGVTCCVQMVYLNGLSLELDTLDFLRNKTSITEGCLKVGFTPKSNQMECFSFTLLYFLTTIFYVAIKYLKQFKKQVDNPFQAVLIKNNSIDQFTKIIEFNFISFKPFFRKVVGACPKVTLQLQSRAGGIAFHSHYFFLMRPLFSLTRLDTFFICESLKLPIYPDKSNLRVDFLRNRIRKQILPAIRILLNPQFDTILCRFYE